MRAHKLGAAGTVIDGRVRDLQEHRDLDYPVSDNTAIVAILKGILSVECCTVSRSQLFARGVGTTAGGAVCRPSEINVPIRLATELQEIWVRPGDLIIADLDGVVCLPVDLAEKVLEVISPLVEADKKAGDAIMQGWTVAAAFKEFRGK
jgi:regulator of RNase E activity RraA